MGNRVIDILDAGFPRSSGVDVYERGYRKTAEKEKFKEWYVLTNKERRGRGFPIKQQDFCKVLKVTSNTLVRWGKECREEGIYPPKNPRPIKNHYKEPSELPPEMQEQLDIRELVKQGFWTSERIEAVNQALFLSGTGKGGGNPNALKLIKQITGELIEKKEVTFVLSADDYFRIRREAQGRIQRLTGEGDRGRGVQPESTLLLPKDGVSSEQKHTEDGEVAAVGLST